MEKESFLSKIEIPDFSNVIDEIYDGYVRYYNGSEAGNSKERNNFNPAKIQACANLMQIISGLENKIPRQERYCKAQVDFLYSDLEALLTGFKQSKFALHPEILEGLKKHNKSSKEYLEDNINWVKETIKVIFSEVKDGTAQNFGKLFNDDMKRLKKVFLRIEREVLEYKFTETFIDFFNEGIRSNGNLFKFTHHIKSLKNLTGYIIIHNYPDEVPDYSNLSEAEKESLTKSNSKRGNKDFINSKINIPEGFYEEADRLKEENPKQTKNWIVLILINKFFNRDTSKKSTVNRRLTEHWKK